MEEVNVKAALERFQSKTVKRKKKVLELPVVECKYASLRRTVIQYLCLKMILFLYIWMYKSSNSSQGFASTRSPCVSQCILFNSS